MKNTFTLLLMFVLISFDGISQKVEGISIMDAVVLKEGMEEKYIEVEEFWSKIHEELIKEGKKVDWSIWKRLPGEPVSIDSKPADFFIFNNFESIEQMQANNDIDYVAIAQKVHGISKKKATKMIDSSSDPREATRSYTLSILSRAMAQDLKIEKGTIASISLMQEKNDDYESFEMEVFKNQFQKRIDAGAQNFWGFTRVENRSENAYNQFSHICFNINGEKEYNGKDDFKTQKLVELGMKSRDMIPNPGSMECVFIKQ